MKKKIKFMSLSLLATLPIISTLSVISCQDSQAIKKQRKDELEKYIEQKEKEKEIFVFVNNNDFVENEKQAKVNSLFKFNKQLLTIKEKKSLEILKQNFQLVNKNVYDYPEEKLKEEEKRVSDLMKKFEDKINSFINSKGGDNLWKTYNIIINFNDNQYPDKKRPFIDSVDILQNVIQVNELRYIDILSDITKEPPVITSDYSNDKSMSLILIEKTKFSEEIKISLEKISTWDQFNSLKNDKNKIRLSESITFIK